MDVEKLFSKRVSLEHEYYKVDLIFENDRFIKNGLSEDYDAEQIISIGSGNDGTLLIHVSKNDVLIKEALLVGIHDGLYLHKIRKGIDYQSVKLFGDNLILSLGIRLVSIHIPSLTLNWNIQPDSVSIFEYYDLENDILLRGEMAIHRIDLNGKIKWSYHGRDIWVNIDGMSEVNLEDGKIRLVDFEGSQYWLDYDGKEIEVKLYQSAYKKTIPKKQTSKWAWKFWKK